MRHGTVARLRASARRGAPPPLLLTALLALVFASPVAVVADDKMTPTQAAAFADAFKRGGPVRALVRLKSQTTNGSTSSNRRFQAERLLNLQATDGSTAAVSTKARRSLRQVGRLPVVAMDVTSADLAALAALPEVASIAVDRLFRPALDTVGPLIGSGASNLDGATGAGTMVAVLDSGVDTNNPTFAGKQILEACFSVGSGASLSLCPSGADVQFGSGSAAPCRRLRSCQHGTAVAAAAVGAHPDHTGVAPDADLVAVQVFSHVYGREICASGRGCLRAWESSVLAALEYVNDLRREQPIAAVNLSLGGFPYRSVAQCDAAHPTYKALIDQLRGAGIPTVIAAGNAGAADGIAAPGCISSAISVGATDSFDEVASFSNRASWLAMLAPGEKITTPTAFGGLRDLTGTSLASPLVAGSFAALKSLHPGRSLAELEAALAFGGVDVLDDATDLSYPRLSLQSAVDVLDQGSPYTTTTVIDDEDGVSERGQFQRSSPEQLAYGGTLRRSSEGIDSRYAWQATLPRAGEYRVFGWWPESPDAADDGVLSVTERFGVTLHRVDQRSAAAGWRAIGKFRFNGQAKLTLHSPSRGSIAADAFRLDYLGPVSSPALLTRSLGTAVANRAFFRTLSGSGGTQPYRWTVSRGVLPPGIALNCETGSLTGRATERGVFPVDITLFDGHGESAMRSMSVNVIDHTGRTPIKQARVMLDSQAASAMPEASTEERLDVDAYNCGTRRGEAGSLMMWYFQAPVTDAYRVEARWRPAADLSGAVNLQMYDRRDRFSATIDQREPTGGATWTTLGDVRLVERVPVTLELGAADAPYTIDAIRLVALTPPEVGVPRL